MTHSYRQLHHLWMQTTSQNPTNITRKKLIITKQGCNEINALRIKVIVALIIINFLLVTLYIFCLPDRTFWALKDILYIFHIWAIPLLRLWLYLQDVLNSFALEISSELRKAKAKTYKRYFKANFLTCDIFFDLIIVIYIAYTFYVPDFSYTLRWKLQKAARSEYLYHKR